MKQAAFLIPNQMKYVIKITVFLFFVSCGSAKVAELGSETAQKGEEVSQRAIELYQLLNKQSEIEKAQRDRIKILTNPNPESMTIPDTRPQDFSEQIEKRISAYRQLLIAYDYFDRLTDKKLSEKTEELGGALQESYNAIEQLPDLPEEASSKLGEVLKMITQASQAKKIKEHSLAFHHLTEVYHVLWEKDKAVWNAYLDRVYDDYIAELNTVKSEQYDAKKILDLHHFPFTEDAVIILFYRLEQREQLVTQKKELVEQLNDVGEMLQELSRAHEKLAEKKVKVSDILQALKEIENLLKDE